MNDMCHAAAYSADKPFALVHYSPCDRYAAYTLIEILASRGYRVWYAPEGCSAQESTQMLNRQLSRCAAVIALYSCESADSHDFRKIVTAAVFNKLRVLPVFLDGVRLSCGMQLQIAGQTPLLWQGAASDPGPLTDCDEMRRCLGSPDPSILIKDRKPGQRKSPEESPPHAVWNVSVIMEDEESILERMRQSKAAGGQKAADSAPQTESEHNQRGMSPAGKTPPALNKRENKEMPFACMPPRQATVIIEEDGDPAASECTQPEQSTVIIEEIGPVLLRLSTRESFHLQCGMISVGRSPQCDVCIADSTVSSRHLEIMSVPDGKGGYRNVIRDCESSNGTWIDGVRLSRGGKETVGDCAFIGLGRNEQCLAVFAGEAQALRGQGWAMVLCCRETGEGRLIGDETILGRCSAWNHGAFDDPRISWQHAIIRREADSCTLTDLGSSNGTVLNGGRRLKKDESVPLKDGDEIAMGYRHFVVYMIHL